MGCGAAISGARSKVGGSYALAVGFAMEPLDG
jgi:hypothetical protein